MPLKAKPANEFLKWLLFCQPQMKGEPEMWLSRFRILTPPHPTPPPRARYPGSRQVDCGKALTG